jgi:hypothetical protein
MSAIDTEQLVAMATVLQQIANSPPTAEQEAELKQLTNSLSELVQKHAFLEKPFISALIDRGSAERSKFVPDFRALDVLKQNYVLRQEEEVAQFIQRHQSSFEILREAPAKIRKHFPVGHNPQLVLSVFSDPEIVDYEQLSILIITKYDVEKAVEKLDILNESWWLDIPFEKKSRLCLDLEFDKI